MHFVLLQNTQKVTLTNNLMLYQLMFTGTDTHFVTKMIQRRITRLIYNVNRNLLMDNIILLHIKRAIFYLTMFLYIC
jgi:hypothetical protein